MKQALEGLTVLDFTWAAAGPFCTKYLGEFGAKIMKVESTHHIDVVRAMGPYKNNNASYDTGGFIANQNGTKESIRLNLTHPKGAELARQLAAKSDVVVENRGTGGLKRFGLDYDALKKVREDIIVVGISVMGHTGPLASFKGWGLHAAAATGLTDMTGFPDGEPLPTAVVYIDIVAPYIAICSIMAALEERRRSGKGQYIDISLVEMSGLCLGTEIVECAVTGRQPVRGGNRSAGAAPHGVYRCRGEDRWLAIAVLDDRQWQALHRVMGDPEWATDPRFATAAGRKADEDELDRHIEAWTSQYMAEELTALLQGAGVMAGMAKNSEDLIEKDPQLKHRGYFEVLDHPAIGPCIHQGWGASFSETPAVLKRAPLVGEHTVPILREMLGMSYEEIEELEREGVLK